jgi:predicted nucleic acid-binding protein
MSGLGMIACDTNILFPALEASHPDHRAARAWLESMVGNESFALCELVLTEVYSLLRYAAICAKPLA